MSYTTDNVPGALRLLLEFYKDKGDLESLYQSGKMETEHAEMYAYVKDAYKWL